MFDGSADAGSEVLGLKCKALILEIIHAIDVVGHLIKNDVKSTNEWMWQKQLRFYLQKGTVIVFWVRPRQQRKYFLFEFLSYYKTSRFVSDVLERRSL